MASKIIHYPRLDTVLMVEKHVRQHSGEYGKKGLWQSLPKGTMYQTFCVIFDYLTESGKIAADRKGKVGWIWNPALVRRYSRKPALLWKE